MILKSYIVEKSINTLKKYKSVLLYGENDGIKDDIKNKLKTLHQDTDIINLFLSFSFFPRARMFA